MDVGVLVGADGLVAKGKTSVITGKGKSVVVGVSDGVAEGVDVCVGAAGTTVEDCLFVLCRVSVYEFGIAEALAIQSTGCMRKRNEIKNIKSRGLRRFIQTFISIYWSLSG